MKLYKAFIRTASIAAIASAVLSCDFLNVVPNDVPTLDHAFEDESQAEKYLYTCYSYLPPYMDITKDPAVMGSGEFLSYESGAAAVSRYTMGLITGGQNVSNPIVNNWESDSWYESPYKGIRVCNTFLEKIDEPYDLDIMTKTRWIAEAKFLKAYYNYYLIRMYGPIVISDKNHDISATPDEVREYRTPLDSCVNYVCRLLDEAAADLPLTIEKETEELGRATKPIALAVKAKLLVLAASPLFNGNPLYVNIKDGLGRNLFPQAEDPAKWQRAADAVKEAIICAEEAGHGLYHLTSHTYTINTEIEKQLEIRNKIWDAWNIETIWGYTKTSTFNLQCNAMPRLTSDALKSSYVKGSTLAPTEFVANLFYTENGVPMEEDKTFDYEKRFDLRPATASEKWKVSTREDSATEEPFVTVKMHYNREPRFYATLGFDGALWWGNGKYDVNQYNDLYYISGKYTQLQGQTWTTLYSITGYSARKLINPRTTFNENYFTTEPAPFPIIRMSDLYLLYAECLNEVSGPVNEVFSYIDAVRERAGLDGVKNSWLNYSTNAAKFETKDGMREIIHQERMIELALEGQTMWDIRRWMKGTKYWNGNTYCWNVNEKMPATYYQRINIMSAYKKFAQKDYLWPISQSQRSINPNLVQNYGW